MAMDNAFKRGPALCALAPNSQGRGPQHPVAHRCCGGAGWQTSCLPLAVKQPGQGAQEPQEAEVPTPSLEPRLHTLPLGLVSPLFFHCGRLCHVRGLLPLAAASRRTAEDPGARPAGPCWLRVAAHCCRGQCAMHAPPATDGLGAAGLMLGVALLVALVAALA